MTEPVLCVDFGSTFTKAALVDVDAGSIIASASSPTTIETDLLDGFDACVLTLSEVDPRAADAEVLACSSAGGGLRIAVLGNEALVTAEAGRRVALSSGGKVVAVLAASDGLDGEALLASKPDVVLLTGGTDGGNEEVLLKAADALVWLAWSGPVVVAGNADVQDRIAAVFTDAEIPHVVADNVVPRIGELAPDSARAAIREVFLSHVIGGKHLSARDDFLAMVRGATPDLVLTGVELLARGIGQEHPGIGDVVVVDVGGATTDVHSVVEVDPETGAVEPGGLAREVVATTPVTRTVEGDLGMRWSAVTTVEAGIAGGLLGDAAEADELREAASRRLADPGFLPADATETAYDEQLAAAASGLALRRHAGRSRVVVSPEGRVVERSGKDLRSVDLLICSGGVFRNAENGAVARMLADSVGELPGGWQLPRAPRIVVDTDYVLAAAGLLARSHPEAAYRLVRTLWEPVAREQ